jgi:hypothetical protein
MFTKGQIQQYLEMEPGSQLEIYLHNSGKVAFGNGEYGDLRFRLISERRLFRKERGLSEDHAEYFIRPSNENAIIECKLPERRQLKAIIGS